MKAILSVPAHWHQDSRYAELLDRRFLATLGQAITQGLALSAFIYQQLPLEFPTEVEWTRDDANPKLANPILFVEAEGKQHDCPSFDPETAREKLIGVLRQTRLLTLIPECELCLRVVFDSWGHLIE